MTQSVVFLAVKPLNPGKKLGSQFFRFTPVNFLKPLNPDLSLTILKNLSELRVSTDVEREKKTKRGKRKKRKN